MNLFLIACIWLFESDIINKNALKINVEGWNWKIDVPVLVKQDSLIVVVWLLKFDEKSVLLDLY